MRYKVIQFNRKRDSGLDLQRMLNEATDGLTVVSLKATDFDSEKKAVIELLIDETSKTKQAVAVFGVDPFENVIAVMEDHVANIGKENTIRAINLLPLGGNRALGIIVTEALPEKKSGSDGSAKRKETAGKQNQGSNAGADPSTESGPVS